MSEWITIGKKQADIFMGNNVWYIESLITCVVPIKLMLYCYRALVNKKEISVIESLPKDQKDILWEQAKEFAKGRLNVEQAMDLCRALVALEYVLNLK